MRNRPWAREARVNGLRDRIWTHLTLAADFGPDDLLTAEALLQWPEAGVLGLGEAHFLMCEQVHRFLNDLPVLVRRLTTSSVRDEEWSTERLHGPVRWNRTFAYRAVTGNPFVYATAPARRVHQTPENELLVHVLDAIVNVSQRVPIDSQSSRRKAAVATRDAAVSAGRWHQSRPLAQIERIPPTSRSVGRIRSSRNRLRYASTLAAYDQYRSLVVDVDRAAVRAAVEGAGLVTAAEGTLFELLCLFDMIDALSEAGWTMKPVRRSFGGDLRVTGRRPDGRKVELWYQSAPNELFVGSRYGTVLKAHGFIRQREPRPDMVIRWTDDLGVPRLLIVECKLSQRNGVAHAARRALGDLLAYRRAFDVALSASPDPYGLGIAWGADLVAKQSEIALCSPDAIPAFVASTIA